MIILAVSLAMLLAEVPESSRLKFHETHETIRSNGKAVALDVFVPEVEGIKPAVIVIHGAGASADIYLPATHEEARILAEAGYVAIVPHYFDAAKPDPKSGFKNRRSYLQWSRTIRDAVGYAAKREDVDPDRIGILGSSLGAWVALSAAGKDRRVKAVVEVFGGFPEGEGLEPANFPPTLILHGEEDKSVSVDEAYKLDELLAQAEVEHEIHVYPGTGHGFQGEARRDGIRRSLEFLNEHVKNRPVEAGKGKKGRTKARKP